MTLLAAVDVWGRRVVAKFWSNCSLLAGVDLEDNWRERVERTDWRPGRWEEREVVARAWRADVRALVVSLVVLLVEEELAVVLGSEKESRQVEGWVGFRHYKECRSENDDLSIWHFDR